MEGWKDFRYGVSFKNDAVGCLTLKCCIVQLEVRS